MLVGWLGSGESQRGRAGCLSAPSDVGCHNSACGLEHIDPGVWCWGVTEATATRSRSVTP